MAMDRETWKRVVEQARLTNL